MKLWGGRFSGKMDPAAWELNKSLGFDKRLAEQDVRGSLAWVQALEQASVLTQGESVQLRRGLQMILNEFQTETFVFHLSDEDIHTAVERRLGELIGPLAGKLHTGRSRNDQVATDLRLWLLEHLLVLDTALADLQTTLIERAETDFNILMPGYTHLQRAQAILLSHWWLSHFWPLQRDRERLQQAGQRTASLPLGCGALAGTPFPIDRPALAQALGFSAPASNSLDAVSDRDFIAEALFCMALTGVHLSKLAEAVVLFTSQEFNFFELTDAYTTGSSLMPQKKNPDVFELARGKSGGLIGSLVGMLATLKGLPSTYDKDLQEDKIPIFNAFDTLNALLPVLSGALRSLTVRPERMQAAIDTTMMATDLADYLVDKGLPFREAHKLAGKVVVFAQEQGKSLAELSLQEFQELSQGFSPIDLDEEIYIVFDPVYSISRRVSVGGTAPQAVLEQIQQAKDVCHSLHLDRKII